MKGRNPNVGRRFAGSPIAKSGTQPKPRTGSPSGTFVGTGVNSKTSASPEHSSSKTPTNIMAGNQLDAINKQAPEPFRNPAFGAKPVVPPPQQSGGPNKAYQMFRGSRISVDDGDTTNLGGQPSAVGVKSLGMGSENGKVAGLKQPRKAGNPHMQGGMAQSKAKKPAFYGR